MRLTVQSWRGPDERESSVDQFPLVDSTRVNPTIGPMHRSVLSCVEGLVGSHPSEIAIRSRVPLAASSDEHFRRVSADKRPARLATPNGPIPRHGRDASQAYLKWQTPSAASLIVVVVEGPANVTSYTQLCWSPVTVKLDAGARIKRPSITSGTNTISPYRISARPIMHIRLGVSASPIMSGAPSIRAPAKLRPTSPAHASSAAVVVGCAVTPLGLSQESQPPPRRSNY